MVWYLESIVVQYDSWHTRAGIEWTGKKSYWLDEREVGDGRAEESSAVGNLEDACTWTNLYGLTQTHIHILENLQLESLCLTTWCT